MIDPKSPYLQTSHIPVYFYVTWRLGQKEFSYSQQGKDPLAVQMAVVQIIMTCFC